jgi:hypothetical protein
MLIAVVEQLKINWGYRFDWEFAFNDDTTLSTIRRK